ncbi:6-pyruvoyl trahydropterin synthase family protein [Hyperthermus butylicus]|uniref:6-pyruvoyl trahydropterin synthase family protein n=1 Tax=Hyperthermus butylicus TaxID=54248 RepID=UPI00064F50FF|nr:6-carboxytetrahydropterin synthase [Hyperthermus butylicus]
MCGVKLGVCASSWVSLALQLQSLGGKSASLHGHDYRVTVCVEGSLGQGNVVVDYFWLSRVLEGCLSRYDHKKLNDVLGLKDASAEIMLVDLYRCLQRELESKNLRLSRLEACTPTGFCAYLTP